MSDISKRIAQYTGMISNFQPTRNYISMSHAIEDPQTLINQYFNGFPDTLDIRLKCYKGYQWERDLMKRLNESCGEVVWHPEEDFEVVAFDGLVKGHVEALFDSYPCDGKTVPLDEHLPENVGRISRRIRFQMNAYMKYMGKDKGLLVYESRETGHLRDFWIFADTTIQSQIDSKFSTVVGEIKKRKAA